MFHRPKRAETVSPRSPLHWLMAEPDDRQCHRMSKPWPLHSRLRPVHQPGSSTLTTNKYIDSKRVVVVLVGQMSPGDYLLSPGFPLLTVLVFTGVNRLGLELPNKPDIGSIRVSCDGGNLREKPNHATLYPTCMNSFTGWSACVKTGINGSVNGDGIDFAVSA